MAITPDAKRLLAETIRGTKQDPKKGLRHRLLQAIRDEAVRQYRLDVVRIDEAGLDEAHRRRRERLEAWLDEQTRAARPKGKSWTKSDEKAARARLLLQAEKEAAATLINRVVVIRMLEALGLSKPAVVAGGWSSKGYREFHEFGRTLCINGTTDATEGYATLLQLLFDELAVDLPGLFGDVGLTPLLRIPAASLRDVVETLDNPELASAWSDDTTLGWVYQFWNDFERDALDEKILAGGKVEPHELASKTQMFTDRYIAEWLLQNSLGLTWLCMCRKHGWIADAEQVLPVLEARRADWRAKRDAGEVALDALMPIDGELEEGWKYYVPQPLPDDAIAQAPASVRELKLLDPAAGSGHFLVVAFELLAALYSEEARHRGARVSDREIAESIIENNLHGIDIDPRAIQIAAAALYLKMRSFARDARPRRMNLVAPVLQLGKLPGDDPAVVELRADLEREVGIPKKLTDKLLEALAGVDYLGSLLKVDAAIDDAIRDVELSFEEGADRRPRTGVSGSLAAARETLLDRLETFLSRHSSSEELGLRLDGEQLAAGVRFVRMVREGTYDIVCGNPPYQGLAKTEQFGYVAATYPLGKSDLFAAFLVRSLELVRSQGLSAMVAMRGWMFLDQLSGLRKSLLHNFDLRTLGDLDKGAFASMPTSQMISVAMAVFRASATSAGMAVALQPTAPGEKFWGSDRTDLKRAAVLAQRARYEFDPRAFSVIDGEPVVYWWSRDFLKQYAAAPKLAQQAPVRQGAATSDNARFLRKPYALPPAQFRHGEPWVPYIKGGAGRVWIDPLVDVIKWRRYGLEVRAYAQHLYGSYTRTIKNESFYFRRGIAFTPIGSSFEARVHSRAGVFGHMGSSVFPPNEAQLGELCALMNSATSRFVLSSLNPGLHFEVGDVNRLPIFPIEHGRHVYEVLEGAFTAHEAARESAVEFRKPGVSSWRFAQDWAQRAVDRESGEPLPSYEPEYEPPLPEAFVSFGVGVALGRFGARGDGVLPEAPAAALPAGILFVSSAGSDGLDHPAAAPMHDAWREHGEAVGEGDDLRTYLRRSSGITRSSTRTGRSTFRCRRRGRASSRSSRSIAGSPTR